MPKIKEIAVTLACGVVTRTVTPEELATELELSTVRPALLALLLRRSGPQPVPAAGSPSGEPTEGARSFERSSGQSVGTNVRTDISGTRNVHERSFPERQQAPLREANALADRLARDLDDPASLAWYRQVAAALEEDLILDALHRALNVPAHRLRRSRAALFTSFVAPLVRQARSTQPYAPTPSPS